MIFVHVIGPHKSDRHEFHFEDGTPDELILKEIDSKEPPPPPRKPIPYREMIGVVKVLGVDPETQQSGTIPFRDKDGNPVYVVDHPETVICIGTVQGPPGKKTFTETRRLRG